MVDFEELDNFRRQWKNDLKTDLYVSEDRQSVKNVVVSESPHSPNELDSHNDVRSNSNILDPHPDRSNESGESCYCPKNDKFDPTSTGDKKLSHAEEMGNISKPAKFRKILTREERKSVENKNKFKPFLIAEMLLEGVSGQDSVHKMDHDEDKVRELFIKDRNKKLKLCSSVSAQSDSGTEKNRSFLDIFLADLDDINEIPFFETSLPRELAIKIFMHLDALDLCRCCQVSKAWKSLAEDELLWNQICRHLDYEDSTATVEKSRWKEIVREQVLKERQLRQNWKMRHGEMSTLEYVTGGILCAANSWHHRLVAGYSNGHVRVWDDDDDCTFIPSNTALAINELAECGTVSNIINRVCVNGHLAAASYSQGNVDIWMMNNGKTTPFSTLTLNKHIASLLCSKTDPLVVLHAGDTVWMYDLESSTSDNKFSEIPVGCDVFHLHIVPTKKHRSSRRMLAIGLYDQVRIHLIGEDPNNMSVVHNTISQKVTSLDCNSLQIAVGIHSDDGCMVKLYDLHKLKEAATLLGNTLPVSVINLVDSPQNSIVTGSCDGKIRIYDTRLSDPVITLQGHAGSLKCVQMDDWKVISGGNEGMVIVWDQRMASKLWEQHNRHPVEYMAFKEHTMYTANIPVDKIPESDGFDSIYHRRYRGSLCCYDFSVDVVSHPDLPSNVLSNYDDPEGYNYNINLAVPYD